MSELAADVLAAGSDQHLVSIDRDGARILIINRPGARNAMSYDFRVDFAHAMAAAEAEAAVKVVIVTGVNGQFSAGVDLKDHRANPNRPMFRPHPVDAVLAMTKPVIAAVDGYCLTGGLELACASSFIIATDRARFADTHAKVGLFPGWGLSAMLPRAVGVRRARQMSLTGEMIDAARALEWGLINEIVAPERLLTRCLEIAALIQACDEGSVRGQVALFRDGDGVSLKAAFALEDAARERRRATAG